MYTKPTGQSDTVMRRLSETLRGTGNDMERRGAVSVRESVGNLWLWNQVNKGLMQACVAHEGLCELSSKETSLVHTGVQ